MIIRERLYRFSRTISGRSLLLGLYYCAFFLLFFFLSGTSLFTFDAQHSLGQLLSALTMGTGFACMHVYIFRRRG